MQKNKNYLLIILLIVSIGFSLFTIEQNFLSQINQDGIKRAFPLIIPAVILVIPILIIFSTVAMREIRYKKAVANGIKSVGLIKKVTKTGMYLRKHPEVKFELDVLDDDGNAFSGEVITAVRMEELEMLKEGEPVPIIYKIDNKEEISIDRKPELQKLRDMVKKYKSKNNIK